MIYLELPTTEFFKYKLTKVLSMEGTKEKEHLLALKGKIFRDFYVYKFKKAIFIILVYYNCLCTKLTSIYSAIW